MRKPRAAASTAAPSPVEGYWLGEVVMERQPYQVGFEFTRTHIDELCALEVATIARPERYWLLVETGDEVLDYRHAVQRYTGARQTVLEGGDHGFSRWSDYLDAVIDFTCP